MLRHAPYPFEDASDKPLHQGQGQRWRATGTKAASAREISAHHSKEAIGGEVLRREVVTCINVDSRFRKKTPTYISEYSISLGSDPICLSDGSNLMRVKFPGHGLIDGDIVTLEGIKPRTIVLRTVADGVKSLEFTDGSEYGVITLPEGHSVAGDEVVIYIVGVRGDAEKRVGNTPTNYINGYHMAATDPGDRRKLSFSLPTRFVGGYEIHPYNFSVQLLSVGGVSIGYLNTRLSAGLRPYQEYFEVRLADGGGFSVKIGAPPSIDGGEVTFGGENVRVGKVARTIPGYANPNLYSISLPKTYTRVLSIELLSAEFRATHKNVRSCCNRLSWQNGEDGDHIYHLDLDPGSYDAQSLVSAVEREFYLKERVALSIPGYTKRQLLRVDSFVSGGTVSMEVFKEAVIAKPIADTRVYSDGRVGVTMRHTEHGLRIGDVIVVENAVSHMGIPAQVINGRHTVRTIVNPNAYTIELQKYDPPGIGEVHTYGGTNVRVHAPLVTRFRFDEEGSIGSILGFRDSGSANSVTRYSHKHTNNDPYWNDMLTGVENAPVGTANLDANVEGYLLMDIKEVGESILLSNGTRGGHFAKIVLTHPNQFVPYNTTFTDQIKSVDRLTFRFLTPGGKPFDFDGADHSFTLRVTALDEGLVAPPLEDGRRDFGVS